MVSRRRSSESKRGGSAPRKEQQEKERKEETGGPSPSSPVDPTVAAPHTSSPALRAIDSRIRSQQKAADMAIIATNLVMAVCFIFVPLSCYHSLMGYLPPSHNPPANEPWEHYFDL